MSDLLKNSEIVSTLQVLVKTLKTPEDLVNLNSQLTKITIEAALNGEMKEHLGYSKHATQGYNSGNNRNGYTKKTLKSEHGEMQILTPRDRNGEFNPVFLKKYQTRLGTLDAQILALYANHGNYLTYGLAATTLWVLGIPHGFAVIHGKTRRGALVFDVADLIKDAIVLPLAFICAKEEMK